MKKLYWLKEMGQQEVANKSGCTSDWPTSCEVRNDTARLINNRRRNCMMKINNIKRTLNGIMGRKD